MLNHHEQTEELWTVADAARESGRAVATIHWWTATGKLIPAERRSNTPLYRPSDVRALAARKPGRPKPKTPKGCVTSAELADLCGVLPDTIAHHLSTGTLAPDKVRGGVNYYNEQTVEDMRAWLEKHGRPDLRKVKPDVMPEE